MAKFAELPDGNLVEFPDHWTEPQMDEAVYRDFGHLFKEKPAAPQIESPSWQEQYRAAALSYTPQALVDLFQAPVKYLDEFTQNTTPQEIVKATRGVGQGFMPWFASIPGRIEDFRLTSEMAAKQRQDALRDRGFRGIFNDEDNPYAEFTLDLDAIASDPRIAQHRETIDFMDKERADIRQEATQGNPYVQDYFDLGSSITHLIPSMAVAPVSPALSLSMMAGGKGVEEFRARTLAGETPEQATRGSLFKAATEYTEKVPLGIALDPAMPFVKKLAVSLVAEFGQEGGTALLDGAYDMATIKPDMTWGEYFAQARKEAAMGAIAGPVVATAMHPVVKAQEAYQTRQEDAAYRQASEEAAVQQVLNMLRPDQGAMSPEQTTQRPDQVGPPAAAAMNAERAGERLPAIPEQAPVPTAPEASLPPINTGVMVESPEENILPPEYTADLPAMLRPQEEGLQVDVPQRTDVPPFLKPQAPAEAMPDLPAQYTQDLPAMLRPQEQGLQVDVPETGVPAIAQPQAPAEALPEMKPEEMVVSHGTPHEWAPEPGFPNGRPRLDKIGTGEGAQAFGWGIYTAESGDTATSYQKQLTERSFINKVKDSYDEDYGPDEAAQALRENSDLNQSEHALLDALEKDDWLGFDYPHQAVSAILRNPENWTDISPETKTAVENFGRMYKLDVPDDAMPYMLDWDKPLSAQTPEVQAILQKMSADGIPIYETWTGGDLYKRLTRTDGGDAEGTSSQLRAYGILGARYLDAASRKRGAGTSNFVIWDQPTLDRATMLEKNGKPVATDVQPDTIARNLHDSGSYIELPTKGVPLAKVNTAAVNASGILTSNLSVSKNALANIPNLSKTAGIPTAKQHEYISRTLAALHEMGMPLTTIKELTAGFFMYKGVGVNTPGGHLRFNEEHGDRSMILVGNAHTRHAITDAKWDGLSTSTMAHELGHAVDYSGPFKNGRYGNKRLSNAYASGLFQSGGAAYVELLNAYTNDTLGLTPLLSYPFSHSTIKLEPDFHARELFAQAFGLYYTRGRASAHNLDKLKAAMPRTIDLMEQLHDVLTASKGLSFDEISRAISDTFQNAAVPPGALLRPLAGPSATTSPGVGAGESDTAAGLPGLPEPGEGSGRDTGNVAPPEDLPPIIEPPKSGTPPAGVGPEQSINFTVPDETLRDAFVRSVQDKLHRVYIAQGAIKKFAQSQGRDLGIHEDVWAAEETISGRVEMDLRALEEDHIAPLIHAMQDAGVSQETLDTYLYARHAGERNDVIASRNTGLPDGGSGMTTAEATALIAQIEQEHPGIESLAQRVWAILAQKRQLLQEASLSSQDDLDAWEDQYKHYVPLKGLAADAMASGSTFAPRGLSTKGRESRAATGRTELAASPIVNAIHDTTMAVIRARRNYVGQALMRLVLANPNPDYWQVFSPGSPDYVNTVVDGEVRRTPVDMRHNDNYFGVKFDGKQHYIKLKDPMFKRAMQDLGVEKQNAVVRTMNQVTRYIATVNTAYDLAFGPTNFLRDIQAAVYNIMAEQDLHDGRVTTTDLTWTFAKTIKPSFRSIYRALKRKAPRADNVLDQHAVDFLDDGAKAGYYNTLNVAEQQRRLDRMIADANGGLLAGTRKALRAVDDVVSDYNATIENATRLAAYSAARSIMEKAGVPSVTARKKAAHLAKNLTVNFSRRGEISSFFNGLYAFFNVTFQGGAQFTRTLGTLKKDAVTGKRSLNKAQKVALAAVGWAAVQSMLNEMMSDDDDDGRSFYSKIPAHVRERNMIFMMPDGKNYGTLPLAYGYNLFHLLGTTSADVIQNLYPAEEGAWSFARAILGSFSPLGAPSSEGEDFAGDITKMASPSVILPVAEIGLNSNFFGERIWSENKFNDREPESSRNINAPENVVRMTQWLNEVTGGSMYEKGRIDIAADKFQHWFEFATGGPGRIATQLGRLTTAMEGDEDIPMNAVPFLYRFGKEPQKNRAQEYYYENRAIILSKDDALRKLTGAERTEYREANAQYVDLIRAVGRADARLESLRMQKARALAKTTDPLEQTKIKKKYFEKMEAEYNAVNKLWVERIEKAE